MSKQILEHKGFQGSVEFSFENNVLFGKILHINDLVSFEAESPVGLHEAFVEAVEDYLETCADLGVEPNKPFSGTFNVRIGRDLHRDAARQAVREDKSLNDLVKDAIECHIHGRHQEVHHHYPEQMDYEGSFTVHERRTTQKVFLSLVK
jgi:predicted HicB family RNase H-like nuclease